MHVNGAFGAGINDRAYVGGQASRVSGLQCGHCALQHLDRLSGDIALDAQ